MNSPYSSFPVTGLKGAALLSSPVQSAASSGVASPDSAENGSLEQAESGSLVAVSLVCRNRSHPHRLRESDHQRAEQPVLSPLPHTLCLGSQQASAGPFPHAYPSRTGEASAPKAGRPDRCRSPQDAHRDDAPLEQSASPRATSATALTPHRQLGPVQVAYEGLLLWSGGRPGPLRAVRQARADVARLVGQGDAAPEKPVFPGRSV